jgi:putative FmdB family regulatory protein
MPFYTYGCSKCGVEQEIRRSMADIDATVVCKCGETCKRVFTPIAGYSNDGDVANYNDVLKSKPKWLRFKDGHREKFDPTKHGHRKGSG